MHADVTKAMAAAYRDLAELHHFLCIIVPLKDEERSARNHRVDHYSKYMMATSAIKETTAIADKLCSKHHESCMIESLRQTNVMPVEDSEPTLLEKAKREHKYVKELLLQFREMYAVCQHGSDGVPEVVRIDGWWYQIV